MKTMVCIGDSLTEGTDIPVGHSWPALVSNTLDLNIINGGIGGDTSGGMLSRFTPDVVDRKPAFVFILGGTNDLWWGLEVNTLLGNIFSMVVQARHHGIAPVIGLPLPVNISTARANDFPPPMGGYEQFETSMEQLIEALNRHAMESEVPVVDLYRPFFEGNGSIRDNLFLPDGLHPNTAGQHMIATEIISAFRQHFIFP